MCAALLRGSREDVDEKVRELVERSRRLEKEVQQLKSKLASGQGGDLSPQAVDVGGVKVLAAQIEGADAKSLRDALDRLKSQLGSSVIVLATVQDGKVVLVAGVSADLIGRHQGRRHRRRRRREGRRPRRRTGGFRAGRGNSAGKSAGPPWPDVEAMVRSRLANPVP